MPRARIADAVRLLMAILLLVTSACAGTPTEPSGPRTLTLRYGQTVTVGGAPITFTDVSDSRCPTDVVCAWEGDAAVRLESGSASITLHTTASAGPTSGELAGTTITLVEVKPSPVSTIERKKSDYTIVIGL
jgi:hypothetical protein